MCFLVQGQYTLTTVIDYYIPVFVHHYLGSILPLWWRLDTDYFIQVILGQLPELYWILQLLDMFLRR